MAGALKLVDSKTFPAGLRVLVVDDDLLCLKVVEKMLKTCKYKGEGNHANRGFNFRASEASSATVR